MLEFKRNRTDSKMLDWYWSLAIYLEKRLLNKYWKLYFQEIRSNLIKSTKEYETTFEFVPKSACTVICAISYLFKSRDYSYVLISDLEKDLMIWNSSINSDISIGDELNLTCGALAYVTRGINWYKDGVFIENSTGRQIHHYL